MSAEEHPLHSRRSVIAAVGGTLAVAGIASWWRRVGYDKGPMPDSKPSAPNSAVRAEPTDIEAALVLPPEVKLLGHAVTGEGDVITTTSVGKPVSLTVQVTVPTWSRVLRAIVAVATPGSVSGAFNPATAPEWAAVRPDRHLAESQPLTDGTAQTYTITVSFQPAQPGTYPVFYLEQVIQAASRQQTAPRANSGAPLHNGSIALGDIVVN